MLRELGLVALEDNPEPADEPPPYHNMEVVQRLDQHEEFDRLIAEEERPRGQRLTTPDVGTQLVSTITWTSPPKSSNSWSSTAPSG